MPDSLYSQTSFAPDEKTVADAYLYLLGRALIMRQERIDLSGPGAAYNKIKYNPLGSAKFVNPNLDVAYLEAWIALDEGSAFLLEVPEIVGRYYTVQLIDEWGEVIANINERTFPSQPFGQFAFITPNARVRTPPEAARIELHGHKAKLLARIELRDSPASALELQQSFRGSLIGAPIIATPPTLPFFTNAELIGVELFENVDAKIISALDVCPLAAELQQKVHAVSNYVASRPSAREAVSNMLRNRIIPDFVDFAATKAEPYRNHWHGGGGAGNYGRDFRLRTVVNYCSIWANTPDEVMYFRSTHDADGRVLHGSKSYLLRFPPHQWPDSVVNAYWSVALVDVPEYRVFTNALDRFNLNSYSQLRPAIDDSLVIAIGPKLLPDFPESNWLPSPEGRHFSLMFRAYAPIEAVKQGQWSPPALLPLD
jgi:hypothetical protein